MVLSNKEWSDKMDEIISAIQNGGGDSQVIEDMLSNMWISSATYNVGDYVLYNNNIWKCLVQNSNIAPSEGTIWTRVNITSEISTLNSNLNEVISDEFTESNYTVNYCYVGNICTVKVYRNQITTSDVMIQLTRKLPKKPKYELNVQNYRGVNSYLRISTDGGIYIEHIKSDNAWFNATITFVCV